MRLPHFVHLLGVALLVSGGCARDPGSRDILFQALKPSDAEDLYALDFETGSVRRLTVGVPGSSSSFPARSPAGDEVAFVRQAERDSLFLLDPADGSIRSVPVPTGPRLGPPAWSPDAEEILIAAGETGQDFRLHVVRPDGAGFRALDLPPGTYDCGSWSPDGTRLVASRMVGSTSDIVLMDLWTLRVEALASSESVAYHCPEWPPRGASIAVSIYERDYSRADIALVDIASRELRVLKAGPGVNNAPRWSLDGRWLVYQCTEFPAVPTDSEGARAFYERMEICAIRPDGGDRRRLTRNHYFDAHPSW